MKRHPVLRVRMAWLTIVAGIIVGALGNSRLSSAEEDDRFCFLPKKCELIVRVPWCPLNCPNDYCAKTMPCTPFETRFPCNDYCPKAMPCPPCKVPTGCNDYQSKCCPIRLDPCRPCASSPPAVCAPPITK